MKAFDLIPLIVTLREKGLSDLLKWFCTVPWAKVLSFLGLCALAAGVAFYLLMRTEPSVVSPKPVVPVPTPPPRVEPPPPPPERLKFMPSPDAGAPIALAEGASQTFAIDVQGTVSRPLGYAWFLDDVPQVSGRPSWSYTPDFHAAGERLKEIKVVVSDAEAGQAEIRWRVKVLDTNIPQFPWPPPDASAITHIPDEFFRKSKADIVYLHDIEVRLNAAFKASGYEKSYYAVPGGFALAARLEQINMDGTPKSGLDRWAPEVGLLREFSLRAIAQALFASNPGYFRIIVFVVAPDRPLQSEVPVPVERDVAMKWTSGGVNRLPETVAMQVFSADYSCTALIYEFEKVSRLATATTLIPGKIPGKVHLEKAALWDGLRK